MNIENVNNDMKWWFHFVLVYTLHPSFSINLFCCVVVLLCSSRLYTTKLIDARMCLCTYTYIRTETRRQTDTSVEWWVVRQAGVCTHTHANSYVHRTDVDITCWNCCPPLNCFQSSKSALGVVFGISILRFTPDKWIHLCLVNNKPCA